MIGMNWELSYYLRGQSFIPVVSIFKQKLRGSLYEAVSEDY